MIKPASYPKILDQQKTLSKKATPILNKINSTNSPYIIQKLICSTNPNIRSIIFHHIHLNESKNPIFQHLHHLIFHTKHPLKITPLPNHIKFPKLQLLCLKNSLYLPFNNSQQLLNYIAYHPDIATFTIPFINNSKNQKNYHITIATILNYLKQQKLLVALYKIIPYIIYDKNLLNKIILLLSPNTLKFFINYNLNNLSPNNLTYLILLNIINKSYIQKLPPKYQKIITNNHKNITNLLNYINNTLHPDTSHIINTYQTCLKHLPYHILYELLDKSGTLMDQNTKILKNNTGNFKNINSFLSIN